MTAAPPAAAELSSARALNRIVDWLEAYRRLLERRFDPIEEVLDQMKTGKLDDLQF